MIVDNFVVPGGKIPLLDMYKGSLPHHNGIKIHPTGICRDSDKITTRPPPPQARIWSTRAAGGTSSSMFLLYLTDKLGIKI